MDCLSRESFDRKKRAGGSLIHWSVGPLVRCVRPRPQFSFLCERD
jgi:hypothetical protein